MGGGRKGHQKWVLVASLFAPKSAYGIRLIQRFPQLSQILHV